MSETYIIELNQNNADRVDQNGVYHVTLAQPIEVNPGDQLSLRMASINSPKQDQGVIVIPPDDPPVSLTFSYYDVDYSVTDKVVYDKSADRVAGTETYDYYAAYGAQGLQTINYVKMKINGYYQTSPYTSAAGGSYLIPVNSDNQDPDIWFSAAYSYVDASGEVGEIVCGCLPNFKTAADRYGKFYSNLTAAEATAQAQRYIPGITVSNDEIVMVVNSVNGRQTDKWPEIREGTLKLAKVSGGWPGAKNQVLAKNPKITYPSYYDSVDDIYYGAAVPGTRESVTYDKGQNGDILYPMKMSQFSISEVNSSSSGNPLQLIVRNASFQLDPGRYDARALAVEITQKLNNSQGIQAPVAGANQKYIPNNELISRTDADDMPEMVFRRIDWTSADAANPTEYDLQFDNSNSYLYYNRAAAQSEPYIVGAQLVTFEYGNAGSAFQMSYLHTPYVATPKSGQKVLSFQEAAIYYSGDVSSNDLRYHAVTEATGVVIHDLKPDSLWRDQLAIKDRLVVPLVTSSGGTQFYDPQQFNDKITKGFLGLQQFPTKVSAGGGDQRKQTIPPPDNPSLFDITGDSRAIIGETPSRDIDGGVYLVEVQGFTRNRGGYIDTVQNNIHIAGVVTTQYENADIITGAADSGIPIVHSGTPYNITEATVRILDNRSMKPVDGLGPQNSVFLQVDKAPPVQPSKPQPKAQR